MKLNGYQIVSELKTQTYINAAAGALKKMQSGNTRLGMTGARKMSLNHPISKRAISDIATGSRQHSLFSKKALSMAKTPEEAASMKKTMGLA